MFVMMSGCATPAPTPTPTPTRTATPTPTLTPSPTPTPAFPVTIGCEPGVPMEVCAALQGKVAEDPVHFAWMDEPGVADVRLSLEAAQPSAQPVGTWGYAVVAPFFTTDFEASAAEVQQAWQGAPSEAWGERPLLVTTDTLQTWSALWGAPAGGIVRPVDASSILTEAQTSGGWALVPFHELTPRWKVLRVDDLSLVEKDPQLENYPLQMSFYVSSATRPETIALLELGLGAFENRREDAMTIVAMTGVTAIARGTARLIESTSVTYPAQDVEPWFADADVVHVSNEISFKPDCVPAPSGSVSFCAHDRYIGLLEEIGTNVVELTGNHLGDKGREWIIHTLEMYRERGWQWYGGGENLADATRPLTMTHNGNRIAFIGCNPSSGFYADADSPGAAPCHEPGQREMFQNKIGELRAQGYLPIMTLQHREVDQSTPPPAHLADFNAYAEAGAVIVQGSQAHWVKPVGFHGDTFIHYGPGNFFFDQMWDTAVRQGYVTRYTFYQGRLLSIDLRPTIIEEYGRPRPMTDDDPDPIANRKQFLETMFELRP
ncbi:MAG: hypothetical protein GVY30_08580 [Chloroflexi bacterium]|nr:hypothetical protein [Chloroflexota bacterium]